MRYTYTVAFRPKGVYASDSIDRVLCVLPAHDAQMLLTTNIDSHVADSDRERAVATLLFRGLFSRDKLSDGTPDERVAAVVEERRCKRLSKFPKAAFIVCKIEGDVDLDLKPENTNEAETFATCFNAIDNEALGQTLRPVVARMMCLVVLGMPQIKGLHKLIDCFVFHREDGKVLFSYPLTVSASIHVSMPVCEDDFTVVATLQESFAQVAPLESVHRLLMDSLLEHGDALRAFLAAWTGLEIFVNTCFPEYEKALFLQLDNGAPGRKAYFDRVKEVMRDKYRLSEKFGLLASHLAPYDSGADAATFTDAKKKRDKLSHGVAVPEKSLPVEQVRGLLRKYLQLHLQR